MDKVRIYIGEKEYICSIADTPESRKKGLLNAEFLAENEGMLFIFDRLGTHLFWMKDTKIPLDQIAINNDDTVVKVYTATPESEELIPFENCKYLLEVNAGSGISIGEELVIDEDEDFGKYSMKVLAPDGTALFYLQGGERIFSRPSTLKMVRLAKKADALLENGSEEDYDKACIKLGKALLKELYAQNHRDPEYVKVPE